MNLLLVASLLTHAVPTPALQGSLEPALAATVVHSGEGSATIEVRDHGRWKELVVVRVDGRPRAITLVSGFAPGAWCIPLNHRTRVTALPASGMLDATAYAETGIVGARVAIVPAQAEISRVLEEVIGASELWVNRHGGPWALGHRPNFGSYLMTEPERITRDNVDDWIRLCRVTGITQLDWVHCFRYGDYVPRPELYPRGMEDVAFVVARLRAAGIRSILHTYSFAIDPAASMYRDPRTRAGSDRYRLPTDTALLDEIAANLAKAVDAGGFDGIYFDALDWAREIQGPEWGWYWAGRFVTETGKRLRDPDKIVETAMFGALIWPISSRYGAQDFKGPGWRSFVDRHVAALRSEYRLPGTLGWMPIDGTRELGDIAYLVDVAAANGASISWRNLTPASYAASEWVRRAAASIGARGAPDTRPQ